MNIVDPVRRKALPAVAKAAAAVVVLLAAYVLIESATHRKAPGAAETPGPVAGELTAAGPSGDWSQWCGRQDRNMVSGATGLPDSFEEVRGSKPRPGPLRNVKWVARLGEAIYGSPVVAGGRVYIGGCESGMGGDDAIGVLWCFRESDGAPLWKLRSPYIAKLYNRSFGITSTPTVEGDRVYLLGHLGEVLCLNAHGLAQGNSGPFKDEESLLAVGREKLKDELAPDGNRVLAYSRGTPEKLGPTDADVVWRFDMIKEVRCWPFNAQNAALLIRGDCLYVPTCSVFDRRPHEGPTIVPPDEWKKKYHRKTYDSPNLIVLDKRTGTLLAADETGAFEESFHGAHSSPALGRIAGRELLVWCSGRGVCYAFDPDFAARTDGKPARLKTVWRFRCVDAATYDANSLDKRPKQKVEIVASPVIYHNRVYVAVGNDLRDAGRRAPPGRLVCIDATGTGDITATGKVWSLDDMRSSSSTVAIAGGLLYAADASGMVYCIDADTGRVYWTQQTSAIWASPLAADGKVFIPTYNSGLLVMAAGKRKRIIAQSPSQSHMVSSPAVAHGVVYVANQQYLYALQCRPAGRKSENGTSPVSQP
jgi:outer membrane protein assembly factor BamB